GQPVLNKEELVINENGHQRWLLTSKLPLKDESGNITGIVGIGRDITDRKRAEEALRESEEKFRAIFQNMAAACCLDEIIDTAGKATDYRILDVNPSYERITGIRRSQVIGALASQVYGTGKAPFLDIYSKVAESGEPIAFETYFEPIGKYLEITVSRPRKGRFSTVFSDITERKQLEERIRQVRSDLLFAVSHDLKSPLQALRQTQEMLSELTPGKGLARFQEYSEIWKRNLQRLERMINNLVDSQHGEGDRFPLLLAPCDLKEMVKQVVEDSRGYALAKQVEVQLESQPVPESSCDEEAMARVVENLLTNAVKFSKKGGKVDIRLGMEGDMLRLEVEDHGAGIPANEQVQLFQPFQRGRSAQHKGIPGTGLGLYVSRRIVEEHGGTITLTSEEGKGTTVTVTLPLKE
ncbi:MAG: PAS domain-containing sensor histidine kinase, partial [Coprothermobacterota bacterium]|nr:PAS domain-containing sensor histidine kinase [Coprothermobacterota bacterium]